MTKRIVVWCFNIVVAILCVLSIACYFFGPVWKVEVSYLVTPDTIKKIAPDEMLDGDNFLLSGATSGETAPLSIPLTDIIPEEGEVISLSLNIGASDLFGAIGSLSRHDDSMVNDLVNRNVSGIVEQLSGKISVVTRKVVQSVAKETVKSEVKSNVKKFLESNSGSPVAEEEVAQKLDELGFTDEYIDDKVASLVDSFYEENATVDTVTDKVMATVDEVYNDFQENAQELEGYEEFADFELTEEDKEEIRENVQQVLEELAAEDGAINPDDIINRFLNEALGEMNKSGGTENEEEGGNVPASLVSPLADEGGQSAPEEQTPQGGTDAKAQLIESLRKLIMDSIPAEINHYLSIGFVALAALALFSMLPWLYVLIKLVVKLCTHGIPTVKLAVPIWLGWLFFLFLVGLPSLALMIVSSFGAKLPLPAEFWDIYGGLSISITSITWITAIAAIVCFVISIFYMVMRRKIKREEGLGKYRK